MEYKLTNKKSLGKYDVPLAYVKSKEVKTNEIFVIDRYEHLIEENISSVSNNIVYTDAFQSYSKYLLDLSNFSRNILITNKYYFDNETLSSYPLFYSSSNNEISITMPLTSLVLNQNIFDVHFDGTFSVVKSRKNAIYYNSSVVQNSDSSDMIVLHDITDGEPDQVVGKNDYNIDFSTMSVYFAPEYNRRIGVEEKEPYRKYKLVYHTINSPISIVSHKESVLYYLVTAKKISLSGNYDISMYVKIYTNSKYAIDVTINDLNGTYQTKLIMNPCYHLVDDNELYLTDETYYFDTDDTTNKISVQIGDSIPYLKYAVYNMLESSSILSIREMSSSYSLSQNHIYLETSYGSIKKGDCTYEISNINIRNGISYNTYSGQCIFINNQCLKLLHDNIIFSYNQNNKTIQEIVLTVNGQVYDIVDYDDKNHLLYTNDLIYETDTIKVEYVYYNYTISHKHFCLNPTAAHDYHNNNMTTKIVVIGVVAKEALVPNSQISVFPFYLDRYINNVELYYTYDSIVNILSDQNIVLGTPQTNGISIPELKRYLRSEYVDYDNNTNSYPSPIPIIVLATFTLVNNISVTSLNIKPVKRKGQIQLDNNISVADRQKRFDTAYFDSYPLNINDFYTVTVFKNGIDSVSKKMFNDIYDNLTDSDKNTVKKVIEKRIQYRMIHDKQYIINYNI